MKGISVVSRMLQKRFCIHDAINDAYLRCTVSADACPDVNFKWVLRFRLPFRWLINLSIACPPILFQGDRAFITKDDVMKRISTLQNLLGIFKPFHLIGFPDQLTVSSVLQSPSVLNTGPSNCAGVDHESTLGQFLLYLDAGCLIIVSHLIFYDSFCFSRQFFWPSRSGKVLGGAGLLNLS